MHHMQVEKNLVRKFYFTLIEDKRLSTFVNKIWRFLVFPLEFDSRSSERKSFTKNDLHESYTSKKSKLYLP